jgi:hypothetical protein
MAWKNAALIGGTVAGIAGTVHGLASHYHTKGPPPYEFYSSSCLTEGTGKQAKTCTKVWREGSGREGEHETWDNPQAQSNEPDQYAKWYRNR